MVIRRNWHALCRNDLVTAQRGSEIEVGEVTMFTLDAIERSRITTALVTLVATAAASLLCVAAAVGPALA
jgi:hypothetical protein